MNGDVVLNAVAYGLGPAFLLYGFLGLSSRIRWELWSRGARRPIARVVSGATWFLIAAYITAFALDAPVVGAGIVTLMFVPYLFEGPLIVALDRQDVRLTANRVSLRIYARLREGAPPGEVDTLAADLERYRSAATGQYIDSVREVVTALQADPPDRDRAARASDHAVQIAGTWWPTRGWVELASLGLRGRALLVRVALPCAFASGVVSGYAYHDLRAVAIVAAVPWSLVALRTSVHPSVALGLVGFGIGLLAWIWRNPYFECGPACDAVTTTRLIVATGAMLAGASIGLWNRRRADPDPGLATRAAP